MRFNNKQQQFLKILRFFFWTTDLNDFTDKKVKHNSAALNYAILNIVISRTAGDI